MSGEEGEEELELHDELDEAIVLAIGRRPARLQAIQLRAIIIAALLGADP